MASAAEPHTAPAQPVYRPLPQLNETTLPLQRARSRAYSSKRSRLERRLQPDLVTALHDAGGEPVAALIAAAACVLARYSSERVVAVGTAADAGRPANALPVIVPVDPDATLEQLLAATREAHREASRWQHIPFVELIDQLGLATVVNRNPLFSVAVHIAEMCDTRCDLQLRLHLDDEPRLEADFSARLLSTPTVERFCDHVLRVVDALRTPSVRVREIVYLRDEERARMLLLGRGARTEAAGTSVLALLTKQIQSAADKTALLTCHPSAPGWTYAALDRRSNQYAWVLHERGVRAGDRIGLCLQIGPEQLFWMLAILKCGGVVVPIDATFPRFRIEHIVRSADLKDVVAERSLETLLPPEVPRFLVEELVHVDRGVFPVGAVNAADPIYLLFTSGSTGQPKGVVMTHGALANLVCWQNTQIDAASLRTLHRTSMTFDVSFQEIFSTWCFGGTLVIADEVERGDISRWPEIFRQQHIGRVFLPVIALQQFAEFAGHALPDLKFLIAAGEALRITPSVMRLFRTLQATLINHYGPTESHVVTSYTLPADSATWPPLPPIGTPVDNTHLLILDAFGQPVPLGVDGEIFIVGKQLARGYHRNEALTAQRFVSLELPELRGVRAYRTGDFARFSADGIIEFVGRRDDQVKLRGYRIELAELETTLVSIPGIRQAAARLWADERSESRLAAYVVCDATAPANSQIRQVLKDKLPDYMVPAPSHLLRLEALPLTTTGKVDRRSLPPPRIAEDSADRSTLGGGSLPEVVRSTWSKHLQAPQIASTDAFLDLGGHSLLAIQVVAEINERLQTAVPLAELLRGPTLEQFTAAVDRARKKPSSDGAVMDPDAAPSVELPDGTHVYAPYPPEALYLYSDIYEYRNYHQHGIEYRDDACVVDVGANIGLFTLYALNHAKRSKIIAIEPAPQLWTQLKRNVSQYGERVVAVNLAVAERDYTGEFTYYPATPGMSSLHPDLQQERELLAQILGNLADSGRPEIRQLFKEEHRYLEQRLMTERFPCRVRRLSRVCAELGVRAVDLLKIDVQKAELDVLRGIDDSDWPNIRQLVIEVHDLDGRLQQVVGFLKQHHYQVTLAEQTPIHRGSVIRFAYARRLN